MKKKRKKVHLISAATGEGLKALLDDCAKVLYTKPAPKRSRARAGAESRGR